MTGPYFYSHVTMYLDCVATNKLVIKITTVIELLVCGARGDLFQHSRAEP